jgi:GAG-pre-integrase domain
MNKGEEAHIAVIDSKEKKRKSKNGKGKGPNKTADNNDAKKQKKDNTYEKSRDKVIYHFCKKARHIKRHYTNYNAWLAKKGMCFGLVCSEVNLSIVSKYSWWLDSGVTSNISISEQGCLNLRKPTEAERYIYVGNSGKVEVEGIETFKLLCKTGSYLYFDALVVPSFRRNLIFISYLDKNGFVCSFSNENFSLFQNSKEVASGSLSSNDNLYFFDIDTSHTEALHTNTKKHKLIKENSATLCHKRLGHISMKRIERLVSNDILQLLDFTNLIECVNYIKGK